MAIGAGDRGSALRYLSWLAPNVPEIDADSEFRVSLAALATFERDPQRVLVLLGSQKDAVPIVDSMDDLASVLRANAYEMMGDLPHATQILQELETPRMLGLVRERFPSLAICAQSGSVYEAAAAQRSVQAAAAAGALGTVFGAVLGFAGLVALLAGAVPLVLSGGGFEAGGFVTSALGAVLLVAGILVVVAARNRGRHAAWLRTNGLSLQGRIVNAERTGTDINDVPVYRFIVQVAGPHGPYAATFDKLAPEHQVAVAMGRDVRVRANPGNLREIILED